MKCPSCDGKSYVVKTERLEDSKSDNPLPMLKKRRRLCKECRDPFYTYEMYSDQYLTFKQLSESKKRLKRIAESRYLRKKK